MVETINDKIDQLELAMQDYDPIDCPVQHRFVPGLYIREIFMKKGLMITSLIHRTNHPFFVMQGIVSVFSDNDGEQLIEAPHVGITTACTRRVLYTHEDTVWVTTHPTDIQPKSHSIEDVLEAVALVESKIIEPHVNSFLGGSIKNNIITKNLKP